jgi:hypothetical protein
MDLILFLSALVIAWLIFMWVLKVLKATLTTAVVVAAIAAALYIVVGIGPQDLWNQIWSLPQMLMEWVSGGN